jgi:tetrahydromethanopterin S-methyltransferase subunit F
MKIPLLYGLAITLAGAVLTLVLHLTGVTTEPGNFLLVALLGLPVVLAIVATGIVLGTRAARRPFEKAGFSYGQAFTTGFKITLFSAVGGVLFSALYYGVIFPDFAEVQIESTRSLLEKIGAREADIERAVEDIRTKSTFARQLVSAFISNMVMGTIVSLITAAFMKRAPADEFAATPPRV